MNLAHLHLLLNHFPTVGTLVAIGLFIAGLIRKNDDLKRASFGVFLAVAILASPIYMTGKAAQYYIEGQEEVSMPMMVAHQDAALLALLFMEVTGAIAWLGLWQYRRIARLGQGIVGSVLVLSIVTFGLMVRTADMGAEIRHPEVMGAAEEAVQAVPAPAPGLGTQGILAQVGAVQEIAEPPAVPASGEFFNSAAIAEFVNQTNWAWPLFESLHFIGLCLLVGVVLVVNLRMLGVTKQISFAALHRLLPWAMLGLAINLVTGILFFITVPEQYTTNVSLHWKMVFMLLAAVNAVYFTIFDEPWAVGVGDNPPLTSKIMAATTIFLWLGVVYFGRMMPFLGNSF